MPFIMEFYINSQHLKKRTSYNFGNNSEYFILVCQHCSKEKKVKKEPYVTTEKTYWSDDRVKSCDNREISYIQRCPHCGQYFFANPEEATVGFGSDFVDGRMDVAELAAICSDKNLIESIEPGMKATLFMQYVHTYNDTYRRYNDDEEKAPYKQSKMFTDAVLFLTERCRIPKTVIADLYRQAGMFRKCLEYSADIANGMHGEELEILDKTRYLAIKGETAPFITKTEK